MDKIKFRFDGIWYLGDKQAFDVLYKLVWLVGIAQGNRSAVSDLLARFIRAGRVEEV